MRPAPAALLLCTVVALALAGCTAPTHPTHSSSAGPVPATEPPDPIAGMTLAQLVGQVFMVGTTAGAAEGVSLTAVSQLHVGNIFLSGRSSLGVAGTATVVNRFRSRVTVATTARQPLLVATDEEGGEVQVLSGPGFRTMPTGVAQSAQSPATIRTESAGWGASLSAAGVNMNLAPVVDLVDSRASATANPPIGAFQREIGFTVGGIVSHANAFRAGMASSRVLSVLKHFPGLGHVTENTDTSRGVVDTTVGSGGADLSIYRTEIAAGAPCIMISSSVYSKLDPSSPAIFSHRIVTDLLRGTLGFRGVIISDDLSAAAQVSRYSPAARAIDAISAGDDIVLVSSRPELAAPMIAAVLARAQSDPGFAALIKAAARRVVELKRRYLALDYPNGGANPAESNENSTRPFL
jgi:beta-N-acetylhexosaminidase